MAVIFYLDVEKLVECDVKLITETETQVRDYTSFCFRKKGYINFVPKLVHPLSFLTSVCMSLYPSTLLVIVSSTEPLDIATLNFADA